MAQNITLLGASYSDVPAVTLPKTGGGTAQFDDTSDANATAADIAQNKTAYVNGVKLVGTASGGGGGGATNVVSGTFKYTAAGWYTISLPYSGTGYPIAASIFVKNGVEDSTFSSTLRRYAVSTFYVLKENTTVSPTYSGDTAHGQYRYKNSTSSASSLTTSAGASSVTYGTDEATSNSVLNSLRISGQKEIKVRMVEVGVSESRYGFLVNTDYTYVVVYSS